MGGVCGEVVWLPCKEMDGNYKLLTKTMLNITKS